MMRTASWSCSGRIVSALRLSLASRRTHAQVAAQPVPAGVAPSPGLVDHVADPPPDVAGVGAGRARRRAPAARRRARSSRSAGVDAADSRGERAQVVRAPRRRDDRRARRGVVGGLPPDRPPAAVASPFVQLDVAAAVQRACAARRRAPARRWGRRPRASASMRWRISVVAYTTELFSARYGMSRAPQRRLERRAARCAPGAARRCRPDGTARSSPSSSSTGHRSASAVATASATSAASRRRISSAFFDAEVVVLVERRSTVTEPWSRWWRRSAASSALVGGLYVGFARRSRSTNTPLTQSMTGRDDRKLADSDSRSAPIWSPARRYCGDVGATESVDRLLRVADDEQPARQRPERPPVAPAATDRRDRLPAARRSRAGSGRCPGTRRAGCVR